MGNKDIKKEIKEPKKEEIFVPVALNDTKELTLKRRLFKIGVAKRRKKQKINQKGE